MTYLGIFGLGSQKAIVMIVISPLKLVQLQNFEKKQKCLNLGPKIPYLGMFRLDFENDIVIFEISTLTFV